MRQPVFGPRRRFRVELWTTSMDALGEIQLYEWLIMPLGAAMLLLYWARGYLRRTAFDIAGPRPAILCLKDLLLGVLLLLMGRLLVGMLAIFVWPQLLDSAALSVDEYAFLALLSQGGTLPVLLFLVWRLGRQADGWRHFGLVARRLFRDVGCAAVAFVTAMPVVLGVGGILMIAATLAGQPPPTIAHEMLEKLRDAESTQTIALFLISAVVIAPLTEEIMYRGLVQSALRGSGFFTNRWLLICMAAAFFAAVHGTQVAWQALPVLFALAVVLGWLYERTASLWPSILLHAGFNLFNVVCLWMMPPADDNAVQVAAIGISRFIYH